MVSKFNESFDPDYDSNMSSELSSVATSLTASLEYGGDNKQMSETAFVTNKETGANAKHILHPANGHVASSIDTDDTQTFTVKQKEEKDDNANKYKRNKTYVLSAVKCLLALFMSLLLFGCVILSKISLVYIGQRLTYGAKRAVLNANLSLNATQQRYICGKGSPYLCETVLDMLIILLVTPSAYSFLRAVYGTATSKSHPWPTRKAIIWGIIGMFIEAAGLSLFVVGVLSLVRETDVAVVLMNAVFIAPVLWQLSKACLDRFASTDDPQSRALLRKTRRMQLTNMFLSFFAVILQVGGLIGIVYLTSNKEILDIKFILVPTSIILISVGWCPKLKKLQCDHDLEIEVDDDDSDEARLGADADMVRSTTMSTMVGSSETLASGTKKRRRSGWKNDTQRVIIESSSSRGKATIINSLFKTIFIPMCCAAVAHFMKVADLRHLGQGMDEFFTDRTLYIMFFVQLASGFVGYHVAWMACTMTMQRLCFALPLTLATPATVILLVTNRCDKHYLTFLKCSENNAIWLYIALLSVVLWLGQFFATTYYAWKNQDFIMAKEAVLFWTPTYEGVMLEQSLLLNRKNEATNEYFVNYRSLVKDSRIYICTTMYHEEAFEMEQLLHSIARIDSARKEAGRNFEAHVFFDDGVRDTTLKQYALQLVSMLEKTLDVKPSFATKIETPYGMELKWNLPGGMNFHIHLKDNYKVKNKKRWSQVMYMSYVLDYRERGDCDHAYILTTDADVKFTPDDVMALMDRMSRDPNVGAVCGRTHPMGSGPLVWYQIFDYAIGHWLLKVAEDVLGSVLCSPGCFSIYRARAIKAVLPTYATHVECAMDFLTKDMGEDRWFCTLLVEHGWRLEYCAAAENSTYCPDNFDEFFKQRRRWTPSTLANQIVLIQKAAKIRRNNDVINMAFIIYQLLLMISTIVGPANVILVIASGLNYAFPKSVNLIATFFVVIATVAGFVLACLYTSQQTQLKIAKLLTFAFSIVMTITTVGLMAQVADDISKQSADVSTLRLAPSTLYLLFLLCLFTITALLHGLEGLNLVHGIWYLICLPSGYLFLTIYSVANMTDRSWGTREGRAASSGTNEPWYVKVWDKMKVVCGLCCRERRYKDGSEESHSLLSESDLESEVGESTTEETQSMPDSNSQDDVGNSGSDDDDEIYMNSDEIKPPRPPKPQKSPAPRALARGARDRHVSTRRPASQRVTFAPGIRFKSVKGRDSSERKVHSAVPIEDFLYGQYKQYISNFKENGYDDTSFLHGTKEQALMDIGIINRGHRKKLLTEIEKLPPEGMDQEVPDNVREWLMKLGLESYWMEFSNNSYTEPNSLADLKFMDKRTIMQTFGITKEGHLRKLEKAIGYLAYPSAAQRKIRQARIQLDETPHLSLENEGPREFKFWEQLRKLCLLPEQAAFSQSDELKDKLEELRNAGLTMLIVTNILWLTIMLTIIAQGSKLQVFQTNFLGLIFLSLYTIVLLAQFFTLLWHRVVTWIHSFSRIPFKVGSKINMSWSFHDEDLPPEPTDENIFMAQRRISSRIVRRSRKQQNQSPENSRQFRTIFPPENNSWSSIG
eukprot:gene16163-17786_t